MSDTETTGPEDGATTPPPSEGAPRSAAASYDGAGSVADDGHDATTPPPSPSNGSTPATGGRVGGRAAVAGARGELPAALAERFTVEAVLGRGGMGVVYLCRDEQLGRQVAVKLILRPSETLDRMLKEEARVLAGLEHENVVRLYDFGRAEEKPYLVMELVRGRSLAAWLTHGRPTLVEAVRTAKEIVAGVAVAHQKGIAHFDLKPANVFLDETGRAKVADFGLARAVEGVASGTFVGGTPGYMAPEQWVGEARLAADVYAIGVILAEMLTGRTLFRGGSTAETRRRQTEEAVPVPSSVIPSVPPVLDQLVLRCLAKDPAARPSLSELGQSLGEWLERVAHGRRRASAVGFPAQPYRFLECFGVEDEPIFFGRDAESAELHELLKLASVRLLLVFGPCGIGKSSVLRAGLARATDPAKTDLVVLLAGRAPARRILEALAARAVQHGVTLEGAAATAERLAAEPRLVTQLLLELERVSRKTLLIVLDQGEEVFTQNPRGSAEATALFALVAGIAEAQAAPVKLVLAYRTEFRGEFFPLEQRLGALAQSFPVGEIDEPGLVEAIEGPSHIEAYGFSYAPELARRIARDVAATAAETRTSALPALQIICRQLHDRMKADGRSVITTASYEQGLGGARGALRRYVEERLASVAYREQAAVARQLLEGLTIKEEGEGERFACAREEDELLDFADREGARRTLETLIADRLVVREAAPDGRRVVRLASEVICPLIDAWSVEPDQAQLAGRALARAFRLWREERGSSEHLLSGGALALVTAQLEKIRGVSDEARAFVAASQAQARRRKVARGGVAALVAALALGWTYATYFKPGTLKLSSRPEGAEVFYKGERLGVTPFEWRGSPGVYALELRKDAHDAKPALIRISPGGETVFTENLSYQRGILQIVSDPPGAQVSVVAAGAPSGPALRTPFTTELLRGEYAVIVSLPGHETRTLPGVKIEGDRVLTHRVVKLVRTMGTLAVRTPREGARVVVTDPGSGRVVADEPLPLRAPLPLPEGRYRAEVSAAQGRVDFLSFDVMPRTTAELSPWIPAIAAPWAVRGVSATNPGAAADLDGDGAADLVIGTADGQLRAISGRTGGEVWRYRAGGAVRCTPALADLDRDGVPDAVITAHDGKAHAVSGRTGAALWTHATGAQAQVNPALADLDGDGALEVVIGSTDRTVRALRGTDGTALWTFETNGSVLADPRLIDLTRDGRPEVVIGSNDRTLYALDGATGKRVWARPLEGVIGVAALMARVDGDDVPDALIVGGDKVLYAVSGAAGAVLWKTRGPAGLDGVPEPIGDVDGDGAEDLACVSADYKSVLGLSGKDGHVLWSFVAGSHLWPIPAVLPTAEGRRLVIASPTHVYVLAPGGRPLWGFKPGDAMSAVPTIADLDGDGAQDLALLVGDVLFAVSGTVGNHGWSHRTSAPVRRRPGLAPLDGDATPDVVLASEDRFVYALDGAAGRRLWSYDAGAAAVTDPALADVDRDGVADAAVATVDGRVHAISGKTGAALWTRKPGGIVETRAALADLDADGATDVVVGSDSRAITALSGKTGEPLWTHAASAPVVSDPASIDLDADGKPDVIAAAKDGTVVALAGKTAAVLWTARAPAPVKAALATAPLDADATFDVLVPCEDGHLLALSGRTGKPLWTYRAGGAVYTGAGLRPVARGGPPDVVFGAKDGRVHALSGAGGAVKWTRAMPEGSFDTQPPSFEDVDGDGEADVLIAHADSIHVLAGATGRALYATPERFVGFGQPAAYRPGPNALTLVAATTSAVIARTLELPLRAPRSKRTVWEVVTGSAARVGSPESRAGRAEAGARSPEPRGDAGGAGRLVAAVASIDGAVSGIARDGTALWTHRAGTGIAAAPAVGALGARGLDVVAVTVDGRVLALDGTTGSPRWVFAAGQAIVAAPALADADGDHLTDVIVGTRGGRLVVVSGATGKIVWDTELGAALVAAPAVGDLDGDGADDLVVATERGEVVAFRLRDGEPAWTVEVSRRLAATPAIAPGAPAVVVIGAGDRRVVGLSGKDGAVVWTAATASDVEGEPALADLDGDGALEAVIGAADGTVHALSAASGKSLWTHAAGSRVRGRPAVGDLDGDHEMDVAVACADGLVRVLDGATGARRWGHGAGAPVDAGGLSLIDLDGDGTVELLSGGQSGVLQALSFTR